MGNTGLVFTAETSYRVNNNVVRQSFISRVCFLYLFFYLKCIENGFTN